MVMITQSRFARFRAAVSSSKAFPEAKTEHNLSGRLIQIALAIYLLPALLIVLVVGAAGMLVLAVGRLFAGWFHRSTGQPLQPDPATDADLESTTPRQNTWR
jgi:hypothetical protein